MVLMVNIWIILYVNSSYIVKVSKLRGGSVSTRSFWYQMMNKGGGNTMLMIYINIKWLTLNFRYRVTRELRWTRAWKVCIKLDILYMIFEQRVRFLLKLDRGQFGTWTLYIKLTLNFKMHGNPETGIFPLTLYKSYLRTAMKKANSNLKHRHIYVI